jgi:prepilin-type N-terminal cleavage/methylation domain-containing protein
MKIKKISAKAQGFSLVESAIALLILGLLALALTAYWRMAAQTQVAHISRDTLAATQNALLGFAYANRRLPCPASNGGGTEDCAGGKQIGFVPWVALGLADAHAGEIKYGVYRKADTNLIADADLSVITAKDRLPVLLTVGVAAGSTPVGIDSPLGNANLIDFCAALNTVAAAPVSTAYLNTTDGTTRRHAAFALAMPGLLDADGDGSRFDGNQATQSNAAPAFDTPGMPQTANNDDKVLAMSAETLFAALSCGLGLTAAAHTHFNAASAAQLQLKGFYDYAFLLDLNAKIATANVVSAAATISGATAGVATATATTALAVAEAILSYGALSALIAAGAAAVVANAAALAAAIITTAAATAAKVVADQLVSDFGAYITRGEALALSVEGNAKAADARGF